MSIVRSTQALAAVSRAALATPSFVAVPTRGLKNLRKRRCWTKAEVEEGIYQVINVVTDLPMEKINYFGNFATDFKFTEDQVRRIHEAAHITFDSQSRVVPGLKPYDRFCYSPAELTEVMAAELDQESRLS